MAGNIGNKRKTAAAALACWTVLIFIMMAAVCAWQYHAITVNFNKKLEDVCEFAAERCPDVTGSEIMAVIDGKDGYDVNNGNGFFVRYGIDIEKSGVIIENDRTETLFAGIEIMLLAAAAAGALVYALWRRRDDSRQIRETADYLKRVNNGDYSFIIADSEEGKMSILKSEVYKTAIMLREAAENSRSDKLMLKDHLSDISHQIKTPLTSIAINLENLEEYPNMAAPAREKLLRRARRDVEHMNVMIQTLLKLSRLDADVIEFAHENTSLRDIVADAAGSVSALCELRGITLDAAGALSFEGQKQSVEKPPVIVCDKNWQTEAVTNIIKNAVEHAESKVTVECSDCELYAEITVKNDGDPVSAADRKNMFTRFYRGASSASDSVGIGLSLADAVVRRDGGIVIVDSDESIPGSGTQVIIRYYR